MKIHHYDKHGRIIRKPSNVVADGESISVPLMFADSAHSAADVSDNGQASFESRICDAWKNTPADSADTTLADSGQTYEQRITNAWKTTPADYAA